MLYSSLTFVDSQVETANEKVISSPIATDVSRSVKSSISTEATSSHPKISSASLLPFFNNVLHPCFTIQSVYSFFPYQSFAIFTTKSGCVLEMSFRLLATLFCTHTDESLFSCSNMGRIGVGSFLKRILLPHLPMSQPHEPFLYDNVAINYFS